MKYNDVEARAGVIFGLGEAVAQGLEGVSGELKSGCCTHARAQTHSLCVNMCNSRSIQSL